MINFKYAFTVLVIMMLLALFGCNKGEGLIIDNPPSNPQNNNNEKIIFVTNRDGNDDLYIMDHDGSNLLKLTNNQGYDNFPVIARLDSLIIFQSYRNDKHGIYKMNMDGSDQTLIVETGVSLAGAYWVPAQGKVVFTSGHSGLETEIYSVNLDGTNLIQLTNNNTIDAMPSSIGSEIIFYSKDADYKHQIFSMMFDGTQRKQLTDSIPGNVSPKLSPDGTKILYYYGNHFFSDFDLYIMNLDGSDKFKLAQIKYNYHYLSHTVWSPSNTQIAFTSDLNDKTDIFIINIDGTAYLNLTNSDSEDILPIWSSDGKNIYFVSDRDGTSAIYSMDIDGTNVKKLIDNTVDNFEMMCVVDFNQRNMH